MTPQPTGRLSAADVMPHWPLYWLTVNRDEDAPAGAPAYAVRLRARVRRDNDPENDAIIARALHVTLTGNRAENAAAVRLAQHELVTRTATELQDAPIGNDMDRERARMDLTAARGGGDE